MNPTLKFIWRGPYNVLPLSPMIKRINTKTNKLTMTQQYNLVMWCIQWCREALPAPKIKRRKKLCVMVHYTNKEEFGNYCERNNWLTINLHSCVTIKDIVSTVIHEYCHYTQRLNDYAKLEKEHGYHNNPHEVEARQWEAEHTVPCWKVVSQLFCDVPPPVK